MDIVNVINVIGVESFYVILNCRKARAAMNKVKVKYNCFAKKCVFRSMVNGQPYCPFPVDGCIYGLCIKKGEPYPVKAIMENNRKRKNNVVNNVK